MKLVEIADGFPPPWIKLDVDDGRSHLGPGPEHSRRQQPHQLSAALALNPNAERAIILGAGRGRDPFGQLLLNRDGHRGRRRGALQQIAENRRGHVVGEIGDQFQSCARPGRQPFGDECQQLVIQMVLVAQRVLEQQCDVLPAEQLLAGQLVHARIDFDRDHFGRPLGQHSGQRAGAGADFQHQIGGLESPNRPTAGRDSDRSENSGRAECAVRCRLRKSAAAKKRASGGDIAMRHRVGPHAPAPARPAARHFSTYLANRSVSRFTVPPGASCPSVVTARV